MKYISFVVPCYNSERYMEKCIDSLLIGKDDIEIIIIDDGSTDKTGKIADKYSKKYPHIVKTIHQENGGHGEGINNGLKHATGKYFKVIDSDDWVDEKAYKDLLKKIKKIDSDLIIMNYVYNYADGRKNQVINYSNVFPDDCESTWSDMKHFRINQYLFIHSVMYKKSVLDEANIDLPKHVSYEDNLFIYLPMPYTKSIYYLNLDFYQYFIGRVDQSMQESQLIRKSSNQVLVTKKVCQKYDLSEIKDKKLRNLMTRECILLMAAAVVFSRLAYNDEGEKQYKELWEAVKKDNPKLYKKMRLFTIAYFVSLPGKFGRFLCVKGYHLAHKIVNFN